MAFAELMRLLWSLVFYCLLELRYLRQSLLKLKLLLVYYLCALSHLRIIVVVLSAPAVPCMSADSYYCLLSVDFLSKLKLPLL